MGTAVPLSLALPGQKEANHGIKVQLRSPDMNFRSVEPATGVSRAGVSRARVGSDCQDRYVQDERYFAIEHMDVRREAFRGTHMCLASPGNHYPPWLPTDNTVGQQWCLAHLL